VNTRPSIAKRQRERQRTERKQAKQERREQRKQERKPGSNDSGIDPDIAGIVPGPQPVESYGDEDNQAVSGRQDMDEGADPAARESRPSG